MILDSYYHYFKDPESHSKTRFDLLDYANEYEPLNHLLKRTGENVIYFGLNTFVKDSKRKADMAITQAGKNISSVYVPDLNKPHFGYGDCRNTQDGLLFLIQENSIEIFIAKGQKNQISALYQMFENGDLDNEIQELKSKAEIIKRHI